MEEGKFFYAGEIWEEQNNGSSIRFSISQPAVSSFPAAHSIAQIAEESGNVPTYTMELGWNVDPALYSSNSPASPHLFIYLNKDDYTSNGQPGGDCYNCHFTPYSGAKFTPGEALTQTTSTVGVEFGLEGNPGNQFVYVGPRWYVYFAGEAIGYASEFWPSEFTGGTVHQTYGEGF